MDMDSYRRIDLVCSRIPRGRVATYGQLALLAGSPRASRVGGGAMRRCPAGAGVPCHRVVGADGSLTGYAGGIDKKLWLLDHEGVETDRFFVPDNSTAP